MPTNTTDWATSESFGLADSVIVFASLALCIQLVWMLSAELRPISELAVRKLVLTAYAVCVLMTTILFGILAGKYDISAHLSSACDLGVNACNMMSVSLGLSVAVWTGFVAFVMYSIYRPHSMYAPDPEPLLPKRIETKKKKGQYTPLHI